MSDLLKAAKDEWEDIKGYSVCWNHDCFISRALDKMEELEKELALYKEKDFLLSKVAKNDKELNKIWFNVVCRSICEETGEIESEKFLHDNYVLNKKIKEIDLQLSKVGEDNAEN